MDKVRGSLFGGAVGDALGYPVEFFDEESIFSEFGGDGIREYRLDRVSGKALISDDTQMTLFTANGILIENTRFVMRGIGGDPHDYIARSYQDWLRTQEMTFEESRNQSLGSTGGCISWLADVPELYSRRAPGSTCLFALYQRRQGDIPQNDSKGCGGIMRVAPLALKNYPNTQIKEIDREGAEIINLAVALSENDESDINNIHRIGEGWVAEETGSSNGKYSWRTNWI